MVALPTCDVRATVNAPHGISDSEFVEDHKLIFVTTGIHSMKCWLSYIYLKNPSTGIRYRTSSATRITQIDTISNLKGPESAEQKITWYQFDSCLASLLVTFLASLCPLASHLILLLSHSPHNLPLPFPSKILTGSNLSFSPSPPLQVS